MFFTASRMYIVVYSKVRSLKLLIWEFINENVMLILNSNRKNVLDEIASILSVAKMFKTT